MTDYKAHLQQKHKTDWEQRWENVGELLSVCSAPQHSPLDVVEARELPPGKNVTLHCLQELIEEFALMVSSSKASTGAANAVTLVTYHAAKGLEWEIVFLPCLEEEMLPHYKSVLPEALLEECRLLFVGITRAKSALALSFSGSRMVFGNRKQNPPSRFLTPLRPRMAESLQFDVAASADYFAAVREAPKNQNTLTPVRACARARVCVCVCLHACVCVL
jgi:superfamily I DNA/RNA helicase